jgi:5'-3' exonuclease
VTKTLLVDGDNLFKIGFHGVKEYYHNGNHIGGIFHFVNTLRKFLKEHNYDKVIVFWDGENNSTQRRLLLPQYKENRRSETNELKRQSYDWQKSRIRQYLEDMFIRQICIDKSESDDLIAYYCQISHDETKTIFSSDKDLTQLISEQVEIYSPIKKEYHKYGERINIGNLWIPHQKVVTYKILTGDKSDNIDGILLLGEKTISKILPEILEKTVSVSDILTTINNLTEDEKKQKSISNILEGKTKRGSLGQEFFEINKRLVDLSNPLISEEGKKEVEDYYSEELDPDGRGYKNLMRMMNDDGIFKYLPKTDDMWVEFLQPFLKLTRKEKKRFNIKN